MKICQACTDYDEMGPPVEAIDRESKVHVEHEKKEIDLTISHKNDWCPINNLLVCHRDSCKGCPIKEGVK
jgi:hypothetical protein